MDKTPLVPGPSAPPNVPPPPYYAPSDPNKGPTPAAPLPPPGHYGGTYGNQQQQQNTVIVVEQQGRILPNARPVVLIPPDYTVLAIIATIFFFPLGLVALSMAKRSRESALRGEIQTAYSEAIMARVLSRISISIGSLIITGIILAIVLPVTLNG